MSTASRSSEIHEAEPDMALSHGETIPSDVEPEPDVVVDTVTLKQEPEEQEEQNDDDNDDEEEMTTAASALRMLNNQSRPRSVKKAIKYLDTISGMNEEQRKAVCEKIVDLQGLSILIFSLKKFQDSKSIVATLLSILCEVTCQDDRSGQPIVDLDGITIILASAKKYQDDAPISADAVSIMGNLNINEDSTDATIGDDVVEYCLQVTKQFPDHLHTQSAAARYWTEMTKIEGFKDRLVDREVDALLLNAYHLFRKKKKFKYEGEICQESLGRLFPNPDKASKKSPKRKR